MGAEGRRRERKGRGEGMGPHFYITFTPLVNVNHIFIALLGKYIIDEPQVEIISQLHLVRLKCD